MDDVLREAFGSGIADPRLSLAVSASGMPDGVEW